MTALTGFLMGQVDHTMHSPRRLTAIFVAVAVMLVSGYVLLFQTMPVSVQYGISDKIPIIEPIESEVCAGGVIHFPNVVFIKGGDLAAVSFADAWCLAGLEGSCISVVPRPDMPLLEAKEIKTERSTLNVPATLKPGVWHYQHIATLKHGGDSADAGAAAYIVAPITVKDCEAKP